MQSADEIVNRACRPRGRMPLERETNISAPLLAFEGTAVICEAERGIALYPMSSFAGRARSALQ